MTPSNGNIFRVTGHLCAGPRWIPRTKASDAELWIDLRLNKRLSNNREAGDLRRYRTHYVVIVMNRPERNHNKSFTVFEWGTHTRQKTCRCISPALHGDWIHVRIIDRLCGCGWVIYWTLLDAKIIGWRYSKLIGEIRPQTEGYMNAFLISINNTFLDSFTVPCTAAGTRGLKNGGNSHWSYEPIMQQATGLDARASRVKWPAQFMSHWYGILFTE